MQLRFNRQQIAKEIRPAYPSLTPLALNNAKREFDAAKADLIREFLEHDVTQEIKGGNTANNISHTLDRGNLFSFIGFEEGTEDEVIANVVEELEEKTYLEEGLVGKPVVNNNVIEYRFRAYTPNKGDLEEVSKMPWDEGQSWLYGIEEGISGFGQYIFHKFFSKGRSHTGLQKEGIEQSGDFKPTSYITALIDKFRARMKGFK